MIVMTWLCPWYATETVELYTDRPSYESNIQRDTKSERFWVLVLCLKWKILYLASGSPSTKGHQRHWMNDLQEVWVGQDTSEFCTYDSFYLYLCVFTHIHEGTIGGQQRALDPPELELKGVANLPRALGTEQPRSHARAASALNLCDTSLSLPQLWT